MASQRRFDQGHDRLLQEMDKGSKGTQAGHHQARRFQWQGLSDARSTITAITRAQGVCPGTDAHPLYLQVQEDLEAIAKLLADMDDPANEQVKLYTHM